LTASAQRHKILKLWAIMVKSSKLMKDAK
jgi:hypothetical protein